MISLALRIGPLVLTFDVGRADDEDLEDEPEPELLFHGEPTAAVDPRVGHLVR